MMTLAERLSRLFQEADAHSGVAFDKARSDRIAETVRLMIEDEVREQLRLAALRAISAK